MNNTLTVTTDLDVIDPNLAGEGLRIGVVYSRFNLEISESLLNACLKELKNLGVNQEDILVLSVPGALESPFALAKLAATGDFDALIALGAVVRGETFHFEIVSQESAAGITRVGLEIGVPIANGILTTENNQQAQARATEKGTDCARVAVEMANLSSLLDISEDEIDEQYL